MYEELISSLRICQGMCEGSGFEEAAKLLTQAADVVERKTGSWRHYEGKLTCSECAVTIYDDIIGLLEDDVPRFCPNCGAQMIGGDDDV